MFETKVSLGVGTLRLPLKYTKQQSTETLWKTIESFGIAKNDLEKIQPSFNDLYEICRAIDEYRNSVRYLKQLKFKMH